MANVFMKIGSLGFVPWPSCLISLGEAEKLDNFLIHKVRILLFTAWHCNKNQMA